MAKIYHDDDADLGVLRDQTVAVIGYGNQGRSQALNLRDSGVKVIIGNIQDSARTAAMADDFSVLSIADACAQADIAVLLIPDEIMPAVAEKHVIPNLETGNLLVFASGYNVAFDLITIPPHIDVALVAPRMIGVGVRETYVGGNGFPSFVGVHHDASGNATARMLAIASH